MIVPNDTSSEGMAPPSAPPAAAQPSARSATAQSSATPAAAKPHAPPWADWLTTTAASFPAWLMRPRVRLTLIGALLLVGGLIATNTVWTLPLVIVGALMVAVAWIGHRLEGRFTVEWGESGTQLAFRATIKAAQPTTDTPALAPATSERLTPASRVELGRGPDEVIEGEAHTVEINVTELKALIAAAEAGESADTGGRAAGSAPAAAPEAAVRDIRIRRLTDDPDRTTRPAG